MLETLVDSAFEYAYPLFAIAQTRYRAVQDPGNPNRHAPNTVHHERQLSDHSSRWITAPNNDTLYSNVWIDLSAGPVRIRVAALPEGRYWSLALMDAFTNHFAMVGKRLDGTGPVEFTLVGPGHADSAHAGRVIRAPGDDVWMFCRWLVDGPDDLPRSHAMQERLEVLQPAGVSHPPRVLPGPPTDPRGFLAVVNELLARNPAPETERGLLERWARVGLRAGVVDAYDKLRKAGQSGRREFQGWMASACDIGNFGRNFALRASVALGGLGALEPVEAMYFVRYDDEHKQPLDGRGRCLLRVPASSIPTDSFWSFSMYEPTADGQRFFVENPIARYSVGNRTRGLVHNADGSLDIALQHEPPADAKLLANWLPAPAGPFQIALRTYLPRPELRDGSAAMPVIISQT
jgi:hypothetical protein